MPVGRCAPLLLLLAAALEPAGARSSAATGGSLPPTAAGLRVVVDPATGEIVHQPARAPGRSGEDFARRPRFEELEMFDLPHGARGVVLDGWADHAMRVERAADGSLRMVCARGDSHRETR